MNSNSSTSTESYLSTSILAITALLFVVSPFLGNFRLWGINHIRFLSLTQIIILCVIVGVAAVVLIRYPQRVESAVSAAVRSRWQLMTILGVSACLYFLQPYYPFLGDGVLRSEEIAFGKLFSKTEPFGTFVHSVFYKLANPLIGISARDSYRIISSICGGIAAVYVLCHYAARRDGLGALWPYLFVATLGSSILFCGYIESYAVGYLFVLIYLFSGEKYLRTGKGAVLPISSLAVAVSCHTANLVLLPSIAVILYKWYSSKQRGIQAGLVPLIAAGATLVPAYFIFFFEGWEGTIPKEVFIPLVASAEYSLVSGEHLLDLVNQYLLVIPAAGVLFLTSVGGLRSLFRSSRRRFWFLASLVGPSVLYLLVIDPKLGFARDWDLFAAPAAIIAIAILFVRMELPIKFRLREKIAIVVAVAISVSFLIVNIGKKSSIGRFEYLLEIDAGRSAFGREILSNYYQSSGAHDEAISQLRLALEVEDNKRHHLLISEMSYGLGRYETAYKEALRAVSLDPDYAPSNYQLGRTAEQAGNLDAAQRSYERAVALQPDAAHYRNSLGALYLNREKYDDAVAMFASAVEIEPGDPVYLNNLGSAKMALGELKEAIAIFDRVLRINDQFDLPMFNLARIYSAMGRNDRAKQYFEMFLKHSSDTTLARQAEVLLDSIR